MTVCQHWHRGQCRFGNTCRFEHSGPGGFAGQQPQAAAGGGDITNTLVQTVKVDMEQWEKGRQWAFSCYSPAKETACYPGLDDLSPEELRLEAYVARSSNTMDQYAKKVADALAEYAGKRRALLAPTEQIKDTLRRIYNKESLVGVAPLTAAPAAAAGSGVFGSGGTSSNVFQNKPSVFGASTAAPAASTSVFGSPAAATQNVFGGGGGVGTSSSLFGAPASTSGSVFGGASATQGTSVFGASGSVFGKPAAPSSSIAKPAATGGIFGAPSQPPSTSVFGAPSTFGAQPGQAANNPFAKVEPQQQPSSSVFGGGAPQPSTFGAPPTSSASVFGGQPVFGGGIQPLNAGQTQAFGASSTFGAAATPAAAAPGTSSVFGATASAAAAPASTGLFGAAVGGGGGPFGSSQPPAAPVSQPSSLFAGGSPLAAATAATAMPTTPAPDSTTLFAAPVPAAPASLFGAPAATPASSAGVGLFGKKLAAKRDPSAFTPDSELTEQERAAFLAKKFVLGSIPERPPSKELCSW